MKPREMDDVAGYFFQLRLLNQTTSLTLDVPGLVIRIPRRLFLAPLCGGDVQCHRLLQVMQRCNY